MFKAKGRTPDGEEVKGWLLKDDHNQYFIVSTDDSSPPILATAVKSLTGSHDIVILGAYEVTPESIALFTGKLYKNKVEIYGSVEIEGKMSEGGSDVRGRLKSSDNPLKNYKVEFYEHLSGFVVREVSEKKGGGILDHLHAYNLEVLTERQ